jgi:hypothetical protein
MKFKLFLLILLLTPAFTFAYSLKMNPAKMEVPEKRPLKAGETIQLSPDFWIYSDLPDNTTFKITAECLGDKDMKEKCPQSDWFIFTPSEFQLSSGIGQKITATIKIPRDNVENGDYLALLVATPSLNSSNSDNGANASIGIAVASKLYFKIAGKLPIKKVMTIWLQANVFDKLSASLSRIGLSPKTTLIVGGVFFGGFILISLTQKIISKIRKKPEIKSELDGVPKLNGNLIDLRGMKPWKDN